MRFASFNIAFFGIDSKWQRDADDMAKLSQVIDSLDADLIAFQEIVDLPRFGTLLAALNNRRYVTHDEAHNWISSGIPSEKQTYDQKIVLAFDPETLILKKWTRVSGAFRRQPVAAQFKTIKGERTLTVCGVHLESPSRLDDKNDKDFEQRRNECKYLREWLKGNGDFPTSAGVTGVIMLGDFNGTIDGRIGGTTGSGDPVLHELRGALEQWKWDVPKLSNGDWGWTTEIDRAVIDFIVLSKHLVGTPQIHVLDSRVSDHRPVTADVDHV